MDFGTLLETARGNEHNKTEVRYYSTKFSPPKREEKKAKALSANIQKFLARKEAEEKQKRLEEKQKREELLALRSKDKKAQRRVNVMLKRTKSANQSVIEDAVDKDNTAVTLAGPSQPDEDDYGYVSQEAAAYYNKMMEKYNKMPDEPKFPTIKKKASSNLDGTKDRVRAALEKEKEEALLPHKRKRKPREDGLECKEEEEYRDEAAPPPAKSRPKAANAPPPLNFNELLRLAEQKQHEPIMIEVKPKDEEGPLMTKKQKREFEKIQQIKDSRKTRDLERLNPGRTENRIPKIPSNSEKTENKIPKVSSVQVNGQKVKSNGDLNRMPSKPNIQNKSAIVNKINNNSTTKSSLRPHDKDTFMTQRNPLQAQKSNSKPELSSNKQKLSSHNSILNKRPEANTIPNRKPQEANTIPNRKPQPSSSSRDPDKKIIKPTLGSSNNTQATSKQRTNGNIPTNTKKDVVVNGLKESQRAKILAMREREMASRNIQQTKKLPPKQLPPKDLKPKQFPPSDLKPKKFPPADLKPKQFPPPDVRRREFPDVRRKPPIQNKRRILDDDDEYDSEMDDFIDDGPEDEQDYSRHIRDIFGYDKNKYRGYDEDDIDNMESTFAEQMKEDIRSTKFGIMEDLEDIKREKEEKRRKALMKKRRKL